MQWMALFALVAARRHAASLSDDKRANVPLPKPNPPSSGQNIR